MNTPHRHDLLIDRLADHVLEHGLAASSLRPLAKAAGTSDRMLIYYFTDKDAVIAAALDRVAVRMVALLDAAAPPTPLAPEALRAQLDPMLGDPAVWPFMRLWLEMASRAAQGDAAIREVGARIGRTLADWLARHLDVPVDERAAIAAMMLVETEGSVLLTALGLGDLVAIARK